MKKLIKITTIYDEEFIGVEIKRNKIGIFINNGFIYWCDIKFIDIIGDVIDL